MTHARWRGTDGSALIATLLLLVVLALIGSASIFSSVLDLKSTSHFNTGNQALYAAESGIEHALSAMNTPGVMDFQRDIVNRWTTVYGGTTKTFAGYTNISYQVTVAAHATDPVNRGTITAIGTAPLAAQRTVRVAVRRGGSGMGTGAIHLAAENVSTEFSGNAFAVNGNDHTTTGALNAAGDAHPGISTRNDGVTNSVTGTLGGTQLDNVQGLGFEPGPPVKPSIQTTGGPNVDDINRIATDLGTRSGVVNVDTHIFNNGETATFGTVASPRITHLTDTDVKVNGNITGAGILIADGGLDVRGTIDFIGLILVRGNTIINTQTAQDGTSVLGNAIIRGSLWTADFDVKVGGSAIVDYCEACLALADAIGLGGNIPRPMQVTSWGEL